ncbi:unnamed protein product [Rotaria sordida]|uniref:Uncharacterized protein n=1 Tax=Rotaria sordida TaxID=392033 RepID=A0A818UKQ2_9BILA|nr:unnamed protein product [Rotaria sordida]
MKKSNTNLKLLRQINFNDDDIMLNKNIFLSKEKFNFQRLLGCKYDSNLCNQNEACFDDELFGQCWDGKGSLRKIFTLKNSVDRITNNQLIALDYTIKFLKRYHLNWKDYMTQCILMHILNDYYQLNLYQLELFYIDCLNKDELLNQFVTIEKENNNNINRRYIKQKHKLYHKDPYASLINSKNLFYNFDNSLFMKLNELSRLKIIPEKQLFINNNDDIVAKEKPIKLITQESKMNEPTKILMHMKENYPDLIETLKISTNKQLKPILNSKTIQVNNKNQKFNSTDAERYFTVETARGYIIINRDFKNQMEGAQLLALIADINRWPAAIFTELNVDRHLLTFHVLDNAYQINASNVASSALNNQKTIENQLGIRIIDSGIGNPNQGTKLSAERQNGSYLAIITLVTCVWILFIMGSFAVLYFIKRNDRIRNKIAEITHIKGLSTNYYQDLCRQRMKAQPTRRTSSEIHPTHQFNNRVKRTSEDSSSRSSISSYTDEPITSVNMDIMTGHLILSYMEDHLRNRHRLESEWESFSTDKINEEQASCSVALLEINEKKNRYMDCIPHDHTRIRLANYDDSDYINASKITDSAPKCKYIATQGPMPNTTNAFWQMVWEQGSCVIVALTRPIENGITMCHHYWPVEGSEQYNDFEVNLVSEHIWSDDYVVRSFYLKNIQTMETRTVTQFHFLKWDELCNPPSAKALLDFRRKVNKCFRGPSSPLIVHCNDGVGRTGTYILLDIVLNRIYKGTREINIAATLEHIRDQRPKMVKTKNQLEFVFVAVAEEVTELLKSLSQ